MTISYYVLVYLNLLNSFVFYATKMRTSQPVQTFTIIGVHLFETSPKLSEVNLASNAISRLNDGTFGHLTSLSLLDLSHNSLMRIEDNVFVGMNISHLDLGYNNLRKMPSLPLRKLTAARTLILDGNPLHFLGKFLLRVLKFQVRPHFLLILLTIIRLFQSLNYQEVNLKVQLLKSVNLQYITLGHWDDGTNESSTQRLMFQVLFFFIISCKILCKKPFN